MKACVSFQQASKVEGGIKIFFRDSEEYKNQTEEDLRKIFAKKSILVLGKDLRHVISKQNVNKFLDVSTPIQVHGERSILFCLGINLIISQFRSHWQLQNSQRQDHQVFDV